MDRPARWVLHALKPQLPRASMAGPASACSLGYAATRGRGVAKETSENGARNPQPTVCHIASLANGQGQRTLIKNQACRINPHVLSARGGDRRCGRRTSCISHCNVRWFRGAATAAENVLHLTCAHARAGSSPADGTTVRLRVSAWSLRPFGTADFQARGASRSLTECSHLSWL